MEIPKTAYTVPPPGKLGDSLQSYDLFLTIRTPVDSLPPSNLWGDKGKKSTSLYPDSLISNLWWGI